VTPENTNNDVASELEALKAQILAMANDKVELERVANEAREALEAKLNAEREAAEALAREAAEAKEAQFAQMLTDRVEALTTKGVPPVLADRARNLIESIRQLTNEDQTYVLSEGEEPMNIVDGIFSLLSEAESTVDFTQHGVQPVESNTSDNPWMKRIAKAKATK
jgi:predicted Zn-dependent peptidase